MQENKQRPEPYAHGNGDMLNLHSVFGTIQGEGPFSGVPAIFVRLAGCNLQCPWCDTEYTEGRRQRDIGLILLDVRAEQIKGVRTGLIVITGGEPLRQNIAPFVRLLLINGYSVQIESNGVLEISPELRVLLETPRVYLIVSPKTSRINDVTAANATAFKYVLQAGEIDENDGLPMKALGHKAAPRVARPPVDFKGCIYINPMDEQDSAANERNLAATVASSLKFGHTLGLQVHKYISLP